MNFVGCSHQGGLQLGLGREVPQGDGLLLDVPGVGLLRDSLISIGDGGGVAKDIRD